MEGSSPQAGTTIQLPNAVAQRASLALLHVEDNASDALLMQEYIRGILDDVSFDTATRLAELTPERAERADCALLDLSLPDARGLEALMALREMAPHLPIIVLTGFDDLEVGLSSLRYGADDYLIKNQVDGVTLDRAVRYAIERRRLTVDVALKAEATTMAAADVLAAEAALLGLQVALEDDGSVTASVDTLEGTHEVAVRISGQTGEYALTCNSCGWEAEHGDRTMHSWADRSLGWVLLRHVAFGDIPDPSTAVPTPEKRAAQSVQQLADGEGANPRHVVAPFRRRGLLSSRRWLAPKSC